jgi:hypothetical protein
MIELNPQRVDLAMCGQDLTDGAVAPRLPVGEVTELQNLMNAGLQGEEYCDFLAEEVGEFPGLVIIDGEEFFERFCS